MARNTPPDLNEQNAETGSWIGVGDGPNSLPEKYTGGEEALGASIVWGDNNGGKRARRQRKTEEKVEEAPVNAPIERPIAQEIGAEWVCHFMQTAGFMAGGLKIAPGLTYPKGWALPSEDNQTLFLLSARAYEEGMELFWTSLNGEMTKTRQGGVFPSAMEDLLDDALIGPVVAMMAPHEESNEEENNKNNLTDV